MTDGLKDAWKQQVDIGHHHITNSAAYDLVVEEVLRLARPGPADRCLDLGAGTGLLTLPLAEIATLVLAIDDAPATSEDLAGRARTQGLANVETRASDLARLRLPRGSFDVVVSSYTLHHLAHHEKRELVTRACTWLAPSGRLVVADRMFGRTIGATDRQILKAKVKGLAAHGPGVLWRIVKNIFRLALGISDEHPATPEFWKAALEDAGFADVGHLQVVQEAGVVWGRVPYPVHAN